MATKNTDKALVPAASSVPDISDEELRVLRDSLNPDLNPAELKMFGIVAKRSGLDPFAKQIYAIKRQGKVKFQTSIDGYRSIAARTGQYDGQDEAVYDEPCPCGQEPKGHPKTATVAVYRKDMGRPVKAIAYWHEYKPAPGNSGDGDIMWRKMPHIMLAKVAEANALRKAFPYVMADVYTAEEMEQAEPAGAPNEANVKTVTQLAPPAESTVEAEAQVEPAGESAKPVQPAPHEDEPAGTAYEGTVIIPLPDRVREIKRPDWLTELPPEATVAKTELKFTVGRAKHTALLIGDFAYAVQAANLAEGDTVRVTGERREVVWQENMPTKKEVIRITGVEVLRDGGWQALVTPQEKLELPEAPAPSDSPAAEDADFTDLADEILGDIAKPAKTLADFLALPRATGTPEATVDTELVFLSTERKATSSGAPFAEVWLADTEGQNVYRGAMAADEAEAQAIEKRGQGEAVRVIGTWLKDGKVLLLTAVTA